MTRIAIDHDERYDPYFRVDAAGDFDVPQEDLNRWAKVILAYEDVLAEMEAHVSTLVMAEHASEEAKFLQKQQEQEAEAQKMADEAFGVGRHSGFQP